MTSNDWQNRLLTDEELQHTLASMGALEGMQVLQRQLEIRNSAHEQKADLRASVSTNLDLGMTDVVPMILDNDGIHPASVSSPAEPVVAPVEAAVQSSVQVPAQPAAPANTDADIVNNLNALFATKASAPAAPGPAPVAAAPVAAAVEQVSPEPATVTPALPIQSIAIEPEVSTTSLPPTPNIDYAPKPVVSDTDSVFIPTFANPLPSAGAPAASAPVEQTTQPSTNNVVADEEKPTAEVPVAPTPEAAGIEVAATPAWITPNAVAEELPSAEEAVTAFEEGNTVNTPLPTLVDDLIIELGGTDDTSVASPEPNSIPVYTREDQTPIDSGSTPLIRQPGSGIGSLVASWNGTGSLLFLVAAGFVVGMLKFSLITVIAGAFGALAVTGLGFGTAAVTARRGRQPQATISRAVFGVQGAAIPLVFITLARYAATAIAAIAAVIAVTWYFPSLPKAVKVSGVSVDTFYLVLVALVGLAALATALGTTARRRLTTIMAYTAITWVVAAIGLGMWLTPGTFSIGNLDPAQALSLASAILILVSIVWGTTAADETPNLSSNIHSIKLIAAGLFNHAVIGTAAVVAGFVYFGLNLAAVKSASMGVVLAVAVVLALSHQIRRTADSFGGFGLIGTRWWVLLLSVIIIAGAVVSMHHFVAQPVLNSAVISLLPVVGVPVIAWLAAYGIDAVLRRENYHEVSLLRDYGFYGKVRLVNLFGWFIATVAGLGFVSSNVPGFGWLGYIAKPLGLSEAGTNAATGVWIAFALAAVAPLLTVGKIKDQEAEGRALEERHKELVDVLGDIQ